MVMHVHWNLGNFELRIQGDGKSTILVILLANVECMGWKNLAAGFTLMLSGRLSTKMTMVLGERINKRKLEISEMEVEVRPKANMHEKGEARMAISEVLKK